MNETYFEKVFARRSAGCFFIAAVLFFISILRVAAAATADYSAVLAKQSSYRLTAARLRGTIYDRNMAPITNAGGITRAARRNRYQQRFIGRGA